MTRTRIRGWIALAVGLVVAVGTAACSTSPAPEATETAGTHTIVDELGRTVEVPTKVDRVVAVNSYIIELLIAFGVKDTLVGWDKQSIDRVSYADFPSDLPIVANRYQDPYDYEAIIATDPQIVFIPDTGAWQEAADKLAPYGISVVVITPYDPAQWETSIQTMQDVYGASPVSQKVFDLTDQVTAALQDHAPTGTLKTFYDESPYNAPAYTTSGNTGVSASIADRAHLKNPFVDGLTQQLGSITVDPEDVLAKDPDVIFIYYDVTYGGTPHDELKAALQDYLARPGWSNLKAVQDDDVWIYNGWSTAGLGRNLSALIRAKWAYPDEFKDVDVDAFTKQWAALLGADYTGPQDYIYRLGDD